MDNQVIGKAENWTSGLTTILQLSMVQSLWPLANLSLALCVLLMRMVYLLALHDLHDFSPTRKSLFCTVLDVNLIPAAIYYSFCKSLDVIPRLLISEELVLEFHRHRNEMAAVHRDADLSGLLIFAKAVHVCLFSVECFNVMLGIILYPVPYIFSLVSIVQICCV